MCEDCVDIGNMISADAKNKMMSQILVLTDVCVPSMPLEANNIERHHAVCSHRHSCVNKSVPLTCQIFHG